MVDLCHGPHLPNTGYLKSAAVGAVNRAFWRADVKREPLQACVLCKTLHCHAFYTCAVHQGSGSEATLPPAKVMLLAAASPHLSPAQDLVLGAPYYSGLAYVTGHAVQDSAIITDQSPSAAQRVYGVTFPDKKQMEEYKKHMEEAKKRDHRRLGTQQKLFFFDPVSPGSAFFLPRGMTICRRLIQVS